MKFTLMNGKDILDDLFSLRDNELSREKPAESKEVSQLDKTESNGDVNKKQLKKQRKPRKKKSDI